MIPATPSEQCAHARDILLDPRNDGAFYPELRGILADWLELEAEVLAHHQDDPGYDDPGFLDQIPSVRLARWLMRAAGCDDES